MKPLLCAIALAGLTVGCSDPGNDASEVVYRVNSYKVPCVGVGPMQCLQVRKGEQEQGWQNFYSDIEGFEFEPGYQYRLLVSEAPLPPEQVPADGSSIHYSLVEILEKTMDPVTHLNDIWALQTIAGEAISLSQRQERPRLEIHLAERRAMGTDSCNNYTGPIEAVDGSTLKFGNFAVTRKACMDMSIADYFHQQMSQVARYEIRDLTLLLFNEQGKELLGFRKVD